MTKAAGFDPFWDVRYRSGHAERYPWDVVVTFVHRNVPRDRPRDQIAIVEIGCGTGNNLWFAAREGFSVAGIDGSEAAISYARKRFADDKLVGDFRIGDFSEGLPWPDASFDLMIDRAALTYCDDEGLRVALAAMSRVLKPGGRCLINVYADSHSSYRTGRHLDGGLTADMTGGTLAATAATRFWSRGDIERFLRPKTWRFLSVERMELVDALHETGGIHAEYRIVVEKPR